MAYFKRPREISKTEFWLPPFEAQFCISMKKDHLLPNGKELALIFSLSISLFYFQGK